MTLFLRNLSCAAVLGAAALVGCSTSTTAATTSALTGSIEQSTFPAAVASITVARDDGTTALTPVLDDGSFTALLESGGAYRLLLSADGAGTPVVLDARDGRLRTEIHVTSAGGSIDIGTIKYWDPAGTTEGSSAQALETTVTPTDTTCIIAGTRQACATDEAAVDCTAANDMSDGCPNMDDDEASAPATTTPVTTVDSTDTDADASLPMGLPSLNAPADLVCAVAAHRPGRGHRRGH